MKLLSFIIICFSISVILVCDKGVEPNQPQEIPQAVPICKLSDVIVFFTNVEIGENEIQQFTISNIGEGTLQGSIELQSTQFSIVSGDGQYSLSAGESLSVSIRFTPSNEGLVFGTISLGSDLCTEVICRGTAVEKPKCLVTPTEISFGEVSIYRSGINEVIIIENTSNEILNGYMDIKEFNDVRFIIGALGFSIGPGKEHFVVVEFDPQTIGVKSGVIETGLEDCPEITWTGTGI